MYYKGEGVAQSSSEAVKWWRLAAQQGDAEVQYNLGVMYMKGHAVPQDNVRAYMWFNIAAVSGIADAVKNRDIVARKLNSQQMAQAQKLARDCQQSKFKGCN